FEVVGWSSNEGPTFNPAWLTGSGFGYPFSYFGVSSIGTGFAGGATSTGLLPNLNIFGGATGIQTGFTLRPIPEPSGMALAAFGAALLMIFRRGMRPDRPSAPLR